VDDTLIMGRPTMKEYRSLKRILDTFMTTSGMQLNLKKSKILFLNTPIIIQCCITRIMGFQRASLPSKYIGSLLLDKSLRSLGWQEILTKIKEHLTCFTHRFLSLPGRILLIKSILMAIPLYIFLLLQLLLTFCRNFE